MQVFNRQFNTPPVVQNLIIANTVLWLAGTLLVRVDHFLISNLALFPIGSPLFHSWQTVTYMFLHGGFTHLFFNMFALWMFGRTLEYEMGSKRFLIYYMVCGIGAGIIQLLVGYLEGVPFNTPTVGASGAIFGLLLAFGMLHPNDIIMLIFPPIALQAKWFVIIYGVIELFAGIGGRMDNVAHFAHVGGMLWGFLLLWIWTKRGKIYY